MTEGTGPAETAPTSPTLGFIQVATPRVATPAQDRLEVVLRNGRRLRVGATFDPTTLARLAAALEG